LWLKFDFQDALHQSSAPCEHVPLERETGRDNARAMRGATPCWCRGGPFFVTPEHGSSETESPGSGILCAAEPFASLGFLPDRGCAYLAWPGRGSRRTGLGGSALRRSACHRSSLDSRTTSKSAGRNETLRGCRRTSLRANRGPAPTRLARPSAASASARELDDRAGEESVLLQSANRPSSQGPTLRLHAETGHGHGAGGQPGDGPENDARAPHGYPAIVSVSPASPPHGSPPTFAMRWG